ncbi:unnamed protein product [Parnassius apollo]|uniref:(apollo) hypothetical protein n=1 Tax=Parnassius apollo TaxID=110799 RepID=A0A8S3XHH8_PARAO|nr:unnamed protein product [Parnassius apollo]
MRLEASEKQHRYHNLLDDDHANEMLEGEGAGLAARVADLEVRCARQAEELLCLRSTLADALRRLNALEGRAPPTTQKNGTYTGSTGTPTREVRMRQPSYRETAKRTSSYGSSVSSLPQRRGPQHQSTGSLQSDSPASSSSLSPAPSPSPRATPAPHLAPYPPQPYRSRNNSTSSNQSASPANLTKRWNSTGDFNAQGLTANSRFTTTKSLLNLYSKPSQNGPILKHGLVKAAMDITNDEGHFKLVVSTSTFNFLLRMCSLLTLWTLAVRLATTPYTGFKKKFLTGVFDCVKSNKIITVISLILTSWMTDIFSCSQSAL